MGSNGLVLRTVRFNASISIIIPVREPAANFILPLPASLLNSALNRVAGSGSGSPGWSVSFVGLQVARSRPEGIVMFRIPASLKLFKMTGLNDKINIVLSLPDFKDWRSVVNSSIDLRVENCGVSIILSGVGNARIPHHGVQEIPG